MIKKYNPAEIESKWQEIWEKNQLNKTAQNPKKKKYILDMFPYPSGAGLHVGHLLGYVATDIYSRFSRMNGFAVLHPMGWDAFGLPTENYAIKTHTSPKEATKINIATFKKQIKDIGLSYDWGREINSSDPAYYKWTQYLFIKFWEKGLVYKKKADVNWCPKDQTVLANEQVVDGKCERCDSLVEQKKLDQWFMAITKYAEQLLEGLDAINWPESTKSAQRNWIGKKTGLEIEFQVVNSKETIKVFTTTPINFGASFIVIAPEHPLANRIATCQVSVSQEVRKSVGNYIEMVKDKTELQRMAEGKEKTGVFTGLYALNHLTGKEIPIWVADYVLTNYGTGAVQGCPGHDQRDFEFAKKYNLPIPRVVVGQNGETGAIIQKAELVHIGAKAGKMINSGFLNGVEFSEAMKKTMVYFEEKGWGKKVTTYHLRDWLISRQRYWGAPIPMIYCEKDGWKPVSVSDLPVLLPENVDFKPTGESPIIGSKTFQTNVICPVCKRPAIREVDTMDTFIDSSWYFLRFCDPHNSRAPFSKEKIKQWAPIDLYIGGDHATTHLIFARFWVKALKEMGFLDFDEPFIRFFKNGHILGEDNRKMSKRWGNIINPLDIIAKFGADSLRLYEMFMGPLEETKTWNMAGMEGAHRFLQRVWVLFKNIKFESEAISKASLAMMHLSIKNITQNIEKLSFNTAVSEFMKWYNFLSDQKSITLTEAKTFLLLLAPFAPHISEELWQTVIVSDNEKSVVSPLASGSDKFESIHQQLWPVFDNKYLAKDKIQIVVQINGKLRGNIIVLNNELNKEKVEEIAKKDGRVSPYLDNKEIKKVIYISGKLLNFVI